MRRSRISEGDLIEALRIRGNRGGIEDVKLATPQRNGDISISVSFRRKRSPKHGTARREESTGVVPEPSHYEFTNWTSEPRARFSIIAMIANTSLGVGPCSPLSLEDARPEHGSSPTEDSGEDMIGSSTAVHEPREHFHP
jgi:hypothetical protein